MIIRRALILLGLLALCVSGQLSIVRQYYIDLIADYSSVELFAAPDQRFWKFLTVFCDTFVAINDPQALCRPASSLYPGLIKGETRRPAVLLRPFVSGQYAIPYSRSQYMMTLVLNATPEIKDRIVMLVHNGSHYDTLGIAEAYEVVDIDRIYGGTNGISVGSNDTQLSITWHIILVVGTLLAVGLVFVLAKRTHPEAEEDKTAEALGDDRAVLEETTAQSNQDNLVHNPLWEEEDLESKQRSLFDDAQAREVQSQRDRSMAAANATTRGITFDGDKKEAGGGGGAGGKGSTNVLQQQIAAMQNDTWTVDIINDALMVDTRFNMPRDPNGPPPEQFRRDTAYVKAQKEIEERMEKEKREREQAEEDAFMLSLPPEKRQEMIEEEEKKREEEKRRRVPMGLAARRMAAMMTTLANDDTGLGSSAFSSYNRQAFTLTRGASPLAAKRRLREEATANSFGSFQDSILVAPITEEVPAEPEPANPAGLLQVPSQQKPQANRRQSSAQSAASSSATDVSSLHASSPDNAMNSAASSPQKAASSPPSSTPPPPKKTPLPRPLSESQLSNASSSSSAAPAAAQKDSGAGKKVPSAARKLGPPHRSPKPYAEPAPGGDDDGGGSAMTPTEKLPSSSASTPKPTTAVTIDDSDL